MAKNTAEVCAVTCRRLSWVGHDLAHSVRVCVRFSTVDHYWVPFAEEEHMRLLPMGEAIIALPMLDAGDQRVCYQSRVTLIGVVDQVLTAVVATLGRWRHGFDWILRGYTYGKRI